MSQILDSLPNDKNNRVLCCYVNATSRIQVARITNIPNWYFERVVFPGQRLVFEAIPQALLEIHCGMMASAILSDTIPCDRLCIQQPEKLDDNSPVKNSAQDNINISLNKISLNRSVELSSPKATVSV